MANIFQRVGQGIRSKIKELIEDWFMKPEPEPPEEPPEPPEEPPVYGDPLGGFSDEDLRNMQYILTDEEGQIWLDNFYLFLETKSYEAQMASGRKAASMKQFTGLAADLVPAVDSLVSKYGAGIVGGTIQKGYDEHNINIDDTSLYYDTNNTAVLDYQEKAYNQITQLFEYTSAILEDLAVRMEEDRKERERIERENRERARSQAEEAARIAEKYATQERSRSGLVSRFRRK